MVFQTEISIAVFVLLEFLPALFHHPMVFLRRAACVTALQIWTVTGKGKDIDMMVYDNVNQRRHLFIVPTADSRHDRCSYSCFPDNGYCCESIAETARLAYAVMGSFQTIQRQLILMTSGIFQPFADLIVEMERIAKDREWNISLFERIHKGPKLRM